MALTSAGALDGSFWSNAAKATAIIISFILTLDGPARVRRLYCLACWRFGRRQTTNRRDGLRTLKLLAEVPPFRGEQVRFFPRGGRHSGRDEAEQPASSRRAG